MRHNWFGRSRASRKIELGDLAKAFWQDRPPANAPTDPQEVSVAEADSSWKNQRTQDFWVQYVNPYRKTMTSPLLETIAYLLKELEKMVDSPSVIEGDEGTPEQYRVLTGVSLLDHTLNVGQEALDLLKARENDYQMMVGKTLVAALGHDVGKHPKARITHMPHAVSSAMWLQAFIVHLKDRVEIIDAVRRHHEGSASLPKDNAILPILMQADANARQKELGNYHFEKQVEKQKHTGNDTINMENEPTIPGPSMETPATWISKENLIEQLHSRITCMGFDAFHFDGLVYVAPSVVEAVLNQMRASNGLPVIKSRSEVQTILTSCRAKAGNRKCRLRFKDDFKPMKRWFFIFEAAEFEPDHPIETNIPRDLEGRWLKSIDSL